MRDIAVTRVVEMSISDSNDDHGCGSGGTPEGDGTFRSPSMAAIMSCREASSGIMEHEKTILVMKEHDYAKTPDMSQLAPFFRFLSEERGVDNDQSRMKIGHKGSGKLSSVRKALADNRASLLVDESPLSNHLSSMVSLQATLINQLQEQVFCKGVETSTIKREKEQLEARLERMERRLSVLQKRSKQKDTQEPTDDPGHTHPATPSSSSYHTPAQTPPASIQAKPEQLTRLTRSENITSRNSRSRSSSTETLVGRRHSRTGSTSLDVSHKAVKRALDGGTTTPSATKKTRSLSPIFLNEYVLAHEQYNGLGLSVPDPVQENNGELTPLLLEDSSCQLNVKVPTWRTSDCVTPCSQLLSDDAIEDISDESYSKRHSKPENEEKRRKRWDAQRMRERLKCDQLLRRYMNRESQQTTEKKKDKLTTFLPKLSDIEQIEITDTVVVSAFGRPIPRLKPSVFSLDNFDPFLSIKPTRGRPPKSSNRHSLTNSDPPTTPTTVAMGDKTSSTT